MCCTEKHKPNTCLLSARLRTSKVYIFNERKGLQASKKRRYPTQTFNDVDYADDIALLANTPSQAESLLHSLERAAGGIDLYVNADKTEYMFFNQRGDIFSLKGGPLKLVDKFFAYLGSCVTSTENVINTRLAKASTTIDRLSVIWKSDLTDKITVQRSYQYCYMDAPRRR